MPGNTLTLSTDDGEQAGEENDRMAPHHLFSPSFLPTSRLPPPGRPPARLHFSPSIAARVGSLSSRNQKKRNTLLLRSPLVLFFLAIPAPPDPSRDVRSSSRADHSMVFPSNRSPLNRRLTSRKILRSTLISLLPRPLLARDWPLSLRAKSNRGSPFYEAKVSRMNHVIRSLMTRTQMSATRSLARAGNQDEGRSSFR